MNDCLLVVDLFSDFRHEDGDLLLASLRRRRAGFVETLAVARSEPLPIVYANDTRGVWTGDARTLVEEALSGPGGDVLADLVPRTTDAFVVKPRYSAFDLTPLTLILEQLDIERILLMGTATEMCVAQTAIDAREHGYRVTVITGACATVSEDDERLALAYLERIAGVWLTASLAASRTVHERGPVSRPSPTTASSP